MTVHYSTMACSRGLSWVILLFVVLIPLTLDLNMCNAANVDTKTEPPLPSKEVKTTVSTVKLTTMKPQSNSTDPIKCKNGTKDCNDEGSSGGIFSSLPDAISNNSGMLYRAMYVILGVTAIVVLYFVVRAVNLRRKKSKSRKYGIITQNDDRGLEMEPLGDGNDDDDDYTVFEMNSRKKWALLFSALLLLPGLPFTIIIFLL